MIPRLAAAGLGGAVLSLAFRPHPFDCVAWLAFIPLFHAVDRAGRPGIAVAYGTIFGFCFFLFDTGWVYFTLTAHGKFTPVLACLLLAAMTAILAALPGCFALIVWALKQRGLGVAVSAPIVWTAMEYLRSILFGGFPWDLCGYSQAGRLALIQIADITGVYGVSFLVVSVNAALWELSEALRANRPPNWRLAGCIAGFLGISVVYGFDRLAAFPPNSVQAGACKVGLLQADIPQEIKWDQQTRDYTFHTFEQLGLQAVEDGAALLLWPETAIPTVLTPGSTGWKRTGTISQRLGIPMLVGAPFEITQGNASSYFNAALLFDGTSVRFRYDKIHLVPFGEYMPLSHILPLGPGIAAREADYTPGKDMTVMTSGGCPPFSVLICYEAIFPELARMAVNKGARLLMNITNDGWFGKTAAPYQHLRMARLRSVENRVQLLRCANTGISAAFDPAGRIKNSIPLNTRGHFTVNVAENSTTRTLYTRFGDLFALSCALMTVIMAINAFFHYAHRIKK
jgi:apolipoprotein N-acyltransferase